ncbi:hypothetical protein LJ739_06780 [Aestuariibacter halophilus]|uniref:Uncharacterized protein n=1 Tax=Fluctibacter halophilus TaxID=226011 RepID=A0ABS8G754_9ALTE|nr:hypothetical protein [Aestuariibacter halophilus]MCC2615941.1 hypothetical protein [Aestuariibacter halophilus]
MAKMTDDELSSILDSLESDAQTVQDSIEQHNAEIMRRERREPYGTEEAGRSKFVSNDVADLIESDMPSLIRTILCSDEIIKFEPSNPESETDRLEAEGKTKYVDWLIRGQEDSFTANYDFIKDCDRFRMGVMKYYYVETKSVEEHKYTGIDEAELSEIYKSLERPGVEVKDIDAEEGERLGEIDVTFKVVTIRKQVRICPVTSGNFLFSSGARSLDDAKLVGDRSTKTRGELVELGFSKSLVASLPCAGSEQVTSTTQTIRDAEEGQDDTYYNAEWANEEVEYKDLYVLVDRDGDGIAERMRIQRSGNIILDEEVFDHVPYAVGSAIREPHKLYGRGRATEVLPYAEINTATTRNMLDNNTAVNNPKLGVSKDVNKVDLLSRKIGTHVRVNNEDGQSIANHVTPITIPFIGDKALLILQHLDKLKSQTVGTQMASQGLNADQLNKETATRFEGVQEESRAKIQLAARCIVETGYRKLYRGVAWLVSRCQDSEVEFSVLGKQLTTNPGRWKYDHTTSTEVGLGAGDNDKVVESMSGIIAMQDQLKAEGSVLVDEKKRYNARAKLLKALEVKNISHYFNDPEEPAERLQAENEILNQQLLLLQEQLQSMQNPLAESEMIKAEAKLIDARAKDNLEKMKLAENARQFDAELQAKISKQLEDISIRLTELELTHNADIPGSKV